ncbi:MAG TPA: hypothetical protein VFS08_06885, partial [Gemmatimonadaceae bacterium]|nr:hypothetical protein [Gemmatimonadaceae bacterium]
LTSVRDLRRYGDTTAVAIAASRARGSFLGTDVGFERERYMSGTLTLAPVLASWFRPRAELRARFDLLRDPNRRPLLLAGPAWDDPGSLATVSLLDSLALDSLARDPLAVDPRTGLPYAALLRLPRRLGNERVTTTGAQLDYAAALRAYADTTNALARWFADALQPLDVSLTRSVRSAYDASPFSAGLGFQLGLGGIGELRHLNGLPATSAGEGSQLAATQALSLPGGVALVARLTRSQARTWTRQPFTNDADGQRVDEGAQTGFPDLTLRWSFHPAVPGRVVADATASARLLVTRQENVTLADAGPGVRQTRHTHVRSYPVSGSVTWAALGDVTTGGGYALTQRVDTIPGTVLRSTTRDASAEIGRPFTLPASWGLRSALRTRATYQYSRSHSTAAALDDEQRDSRLLDNGRWSFTLNADTDVAENLTFVLQGARIVTFDENLGRRFVQTVLTAALQLSFYSGELF